MLKALLCVFMTCAPASAATIEWQQTAYSQREVDSYTWRYYIGDSYLEVGQPGATPGPVLTGVVCKVTELEPTERDPGVYSCRAPLPKAVLVGMTLRLTGNHPKLGESNPSAPVTVRRPAPPGPIRRTRP